MIHGKPHKFAGKTVILNSRAKVDPTQGTVVAGAVYHIEDWADRVCGESIWNLYGNFAVMHYSARLEANDLPKDNEVVYGKINGLGHMVHISEFDN